MCIRDRLKTSKQTTQFILVRRAPSGGALYDTNIKVSGEDYNITEDAKSGLDVTVDVNLKQWRDYGTKTATVEQPQTAGEPATVAVEKEREESTAPTAKTYTCLLYTSHCSQPDSAWKGPGQRPLWPYSASVSIPAPRSWAFAGNGPLLHQRS